LGAGWGQVWGEGWGESWGEGWGEGWGGVGGRLGGRWRAAQHTCMTSIFLVPSVMAETRHEVITNRLKAADPTMVEVPSGPTWKSRPTTSTTLSMISGADDPSAISERLATVGFQKRWTLFLPVALSTLR
jgi:hypothetical protein